MTSPNKLYVETTTRCNLSCSKCIKQIQGSEIKESDLPYALFEQLLPSLSTAHTLILNGIGEPLLNPDLPRMIKAARKVMGEKATIGFQSNGVLLTPEKSDAVLAAGLSELCLSLDSLESHRPADIPILSPAVASTQRAIENLTVSAEKNGAPLRIGLEIVLSRQNIKELPAMIRWAAEKGIHFVLVTHLFAYNPSMADESIFELNTASSLALYDKYRTTAAACGIELDDAIRSILSSRKMVWDEQTSLLFKQLRTEAATLNTHLHFANLLRHNEAEFSRIQALFRDAENLAERYGIEIRLPQLQAQETRLCQFIEDGAVFINTAGNVMPCHFLWHSYPCMGGNDVIMVREQSFGNIGEKPLDEIWQDPAYKEFRHQAMQDEYSSCWSCPQSPCEDLVNTNMLGIHDCYGSKVPCGHCRWSIGGLHCL